MDPADQQTAPGGPSGVTLSWRRALACNSGSCVEVATTDSRVYVRDGKAPETPPLGFSHEEWGLFVQAVRSGEFDLPWRSPDGGAQLPTASRSST